MVSLGLAGPPPGVAPSVPGRFIHLLHRFSGGTSRVSIPS